MWAPARVTNFTTRPPSEEIQGRNMDRLYQTEMVRKVVGEVKTLTIKQSLAWLSYTADSKCLYLPHNCCHKAPTYHTQPKVAGPTYHTKRIVPAPTYHIKHIVPAPTYVFAFALNRKPRLLFGACDRGHKYSIISLQIICLFKSSEPEICPYTEPKVT